MKNVWQRFYWSGTGTANPSDSTTWNGTNISHISYVRNGSTTNLSTSQINAGFLNISLGSEYCHSLYDDGAKMTVTNTSGVSTVVDLTNYTIGGSGC